MGSKASLDGCVKSRLGDSVPGPCGPFYINFVEISGPIFVRNSSDGYAWSEALRCGMLEITCIRIRVCSFVRFSEI